MGDVLMDTVELQAESRTLHGKKVKRLRSGGWVPAVLFGANIPSRSIKVEELSLFRTLAQAGSTSLVNLYIDEEPQPHLVLAREIQRDVLTGRLQHVDFFQVQLDHKIKISPHLHIIGESPLVETGDAVLVHILTQVEVECLPGDLIDSIPVDVSGLKRMDDSVTIADLPVPDGVTILADPDDVVVSVVPPRAAFEEEEIEEVELPEFELGAVEEVVGVTEEEEAEAES
jgi:large subunit ribosomal protein L25